MKVEQYKAINQFHIYDTKKAVDYLQSYNSTVVKIEVKTDETRGQTSHIIITLGRDWDYSKTTQKYVYDFLEEYGNVYFTPNNTKKTQVQNMIEQHKIIYDEEMI